jgi:hypothetical protein
MMTFDSILYEAEPYTFLKILYEQTLREEFNSDHGYFYHTTPSPDMAQAIVAKNVNFMERTGIVYGAGIYSFVSNPENDDRTYGPNTVKIYTNIKNYFILEKSIFENTSNYSRMMKDWEEKCYDEGEDRYKFDSDELTIDEDEEQEYGKKPFFIEWQLNKYNIYLGDRKEEFWNGRQPDRAHVIDDLTNKQHRPCDGIIYFGGKNDGNVGVLWNTDKLVPIEWKDAEGNIHKKGEIFYNKSNRNPATYTDYMKWKKKVGKENAKLYAGKEYEGFYPSKNHIIGEIKRGSDLGNINEMDPELQLEAVKINPSMIEYVKNPTEEMQLAAVKKEGTAIQFIYNPSRSVQMAAVASNEYSIQYIDDPSLDVMQASVQYNPRSFRFIADRLKKMDYNSQLAREKSEKENFDLDKLQDQISKIHYYAVKGSGSNIELIDNPNDLLRKTALEDDPFCIEFIKNPYKEEISYAMPEMLKQISKEGYLISRLSEKYQTEELQIAAIKNDIRNIEFIPNPTEKTMEEFAEHFRPRQGYSDEWDISEKLQLYLVQKNHNWIVDIKDPTEKVQFYAVKNHEGDFYSDLDQFYRAVQLYLSGAIKAITYKQLKEEEIRYLIKMIPGKNASGHDFREYLNLYQEKEPLPKQVQYALIKSCPSCISLLKQPIDEDIQIATLIKRIGSYYSIPDSPSEKATKFHNLYWSGESLPLKQWEEFISKKNTDEFIDPTLKKWILEN